MRSELMDFDSYPDRCAGQSWRAGTCCDACDESSAALRPSASRDDRSAHHTQCVCSRVPSIQKQEQANTYMSIKKLDENGFSIDEFRPGVRVINAGQEAVEVILGRLLDQLGAVHAIANVIVLGIPGEYQ